MSNIHLVTGYAGHEHVTAVDQGAFNAALIGRGQFVLDVGNVFAAQVISNNQIRILDGELMMQGRFVRLEPDTYVDLSIENGVQGVRRYDLVVVRYTKDTITGVENTNLVVIKGEAVQGEPVDPGHTTGDLTDGKSVLHEYPLWRIPLEGISVGTPVALFGEPFMDSMRTLPEIRSQVNTIHSEVNKQLADYDKQMSETIAALDGYTKEEVLSDDAKPLYDLPSDGVPNEAFAKLAPLQHKKLSNYRYIEITESTTWTAPSNILDNKVTVICGGGGGGGCAGDTTHGGGGGGGGHIIKQEVTVTPGTSYPIVIGAGGSAGRVQYSNGTHTRAAYAGAGGKTSFGSLVSANGGNGGYGATGGSGGSGGGGGSGYYKTGGAGGSGSYGGGGGGGLGPNRDGSSYVGGSGGTGGTHGGGGGGGGGQANTGGSGGAGGTKGGSGGAGRTGTSGSVKAAVSGSPGTYANDIEIALFLGRSFQSFFASGGGASTSAKGAGGGGGGFGGNGGSGGSGGGGGGGGFGANGGSGGSGGGGGGGYGGSGGSGGGADGSGGGGGGGYFSAGGTGESTSSSTGKNAAGRCAGGGGSCYDDSASGSTGGVGGSGICVLMYFVKE